MNGAKRDGCPILPQAGGKVGRFRKIYKSKYLNCLNAYKRKSL